MAYGTGGPDADSAAEWVASWSAGVSERAEQARLLSERVARLSVAASGARGAVVVTVAGSGLVTDIRLDDRVSRWAPDTIAAEILTVMRRAQGLLASKVAQAVTETVGAGSETGRAVVASFERRFPVVPDDDDQPGSRHDSDRRPGSGRDGHGGGGYGRR